MANPRGLGIGAIRWASAMSRSARRTASVGEAGNLEREPTIFMLRVPVTSAKAFTLKPYPTAG